MKPSKPLLLAATLAAASLIVAPSSRGQDAPTTIPAATQPATAPATQSRREDRVTTVSPARADDPAASFAYAQTMLDLRDENAATLYLQAFAQAPPWLRDEELGDDWRELHDRLNRDKPEGYPEDYADSVLGGDFLYVTLTEPAVRRMWADFGSPVQEQGISTLLPYLNPARRLAQLMAFSVEFRVEHGNRAGAEEMLRRLFVLGQHMGNSRRAVVIDGLVGVGIVELGMKQAANLAELPDAPNRYWALTTLPRPMFDVKRWLEVDRNAFVNTFPELRGPRSLTPARLAEVMSVVETRRSGGPNWPTFPSQGDGMSDALRRAAAAMTVSLGAEAYLRDRGYTTEQLASVNVAGEMARLMMQDFNARYNEALRLFSLPFPQANPLLVELERRFAAEAAARKTLPTFADVMLPSVTPIYTAVTRLQRNIDLLRAVEAVRDYAAAHDGLPPAALDDCRLPVPEDCMTGEPFGYAADGRTFTLIAEQAGPQYQGSAFEWTVTLRE